jgi:hypothetical protein
VAVALVKADLLRPEPTAGPLFSVGSAPAFAPGGDPVPAGDAPYLLYGVALLALGLLSTAAGAAVLALRARKAHATRR